MRFFITVGGGRLGAPSEAKADVLAWLTELALAAK